MMKEKKHNKKNNNMRTQDLQIHPLIDNQKIELIVEEQTIMNDEYDDLFLHKYDCENNRYDIRIPLNGGEPIVKSCTGKDVPPEIIREIKTVSNQESIHETLIDISAAIRNRTKSFDNSMLFRNAIEQIAKIFEFKELLQESSGKTYTAKLYKLKNRLFYLIYRTRSRRIVVGENVLKLTLFKKDLSGNYYYVYRRKQKYSESDYKHSY